MCQYREMFHGVNHMICSFVFICRFKIYLLKNSRRVHIYILTFTELWVVSMEHLQRVWQASRERLPFRTPGSVPNLGLTNAPIVETKFLELAMSLLDFSHRISLGTFSILLWWLYQRWKTLKCYLIFIWDRLIWQIFLPISSQTLKIDRKTFCARTNIYFFLFCRLLKCKIQKIWCTVTVAPTIDHHGGHSRIPANQRWDKMPGRSQRLPPGQPHPPRTPETQPKCIYGGLALEWDRHYIGSATATIHQEKGIITIESTPSRGTVLQAPHGKGNKCDKNVKYKPPIFYCWKLCILNYNTPVYCIHTIVHIRVIARNMRVSKKSVYFISYLKNRESIEGYSQCKSILRVLRKMVF